MNTYNVTLIVNQRIRDDDIDTIFEHADDATPEREHGQGRTLVHFAREAPSWPAAVVSALADLEAAGFQAASVRTDDPHRAPHTWQVVIWSAGMLAAMRYVPWRRRCPRR